MPPAALDPETYVSQLYRLALKREPDAAGLAHWVAELAGGGDPTAVLAGILGSEEFRLAQGVPAWTPPPALLDGLAEVLGDEPFTIVDVGAQMLGEPHIYEPLLRAGIRHRVIGFEPLQDRITERVAAEGGGTLQMLPYAVGDGARHRLHVNNDDATSSLFPLNRALTQHFNHLNTLRTVREEEVETRRMDEVVVSGPVDFLKLDIQGAELMALEGAGAVLGRTALIHCEVEFSPIYLGQPLFQDVAAHLRMRGFSFIDLTSEARYSYQGAAGGVSNDRLLWGDALFLRDEGGARVLAAQALAALLIYRKPGLAEHVTQQLDGITGGSLAARFAGG